MDPSLKKLEAQLESLVPRGLSDEGEESCSRLIDQLAAGELSGGDTKNSESPVGWSWRITAAAASVALGIGLGSGWWLGSDAGLPITADKPSPSSLLAGFDILDYRTEVLPEGATRVYVAENGEVREVWSEVEVIEETVRPYGTDYVVTWSKTDRHEVEVVKSQF